MKKFWSNFFYQLFLASFVLFFFTPTQALCQTNSRPFDDQLQSSRTIDLSGLWMMKDFTFGIGDQNKVYLPGMEPKDCIPCAVPGTVRTALLAAGQIPDPYIGYDNEKSLWVEQKEWWFFKRFSVTEDLKGMSISLVFEGTSFQGECWLNGHHVGDLKGMLNPRSFDVSGLLKYGQENSIAVRLEATPDEWSKTMIDGLTWRESRRQLYSIAQCMYGWDWGPHGLPIGLWQPVKLRITGPVRVDNLYVRTKMISTDYAMCKVQVDVRNLTAEPIDADLTGFITEKKTRKATGEFTQAVRLNVGETKTLTFDVKVRDPKLWWPNGMGEQNLYSLTARVSTGGTNSDNVSTQFGIRELKLVENENVGEFLKTMGQDVGNVYHLGKAVGSYPWTFQVNGKKMFAKGGNWIPIDELLRLDHDRYDRLLTLFRDAKFNLFRVWGGGLYETEDFYNLCDEYGILTWQEFLSNQNFSKIDCESFLDGARSAVLRLRNHPSLTFWCGGNEFDPDDTGSKSVIDSLGDLLAKLDPQREFHRASPYKGDDHYWGVWHGKEPYTNYRVVRPFRSEAGLNAPPVKEDYVKFTPENLLWPPDTTYIEYHGESNTSFQHLIKLSRYTNEFGEPSNIEEFITRGQLYQAIGNEFNMEFCRENKFRNSGFLVWQYDDIWPCLSWSLVDWYGTPKASYYFLKRASRPVHISADYERYLWRAGETFKTDFYLLNDTESPLTGLKYVAKLIGCNGLTLDENSGTAQTGANSSTNVGGIGYKIPDSMKGKSFFVSVELRDTSGNKISDALYPIAVSGTGDLNDYNNIFDGISKMPKAMLKVDAVDAGLTIGGDGKGVAALRIMNPDSCIAYFVCAGMLEDSGTLKTSYQDNYISLLPGETKVIPVKVECKNSTGIPGKVHFRISGINCPPQDLELEVKR